MKVRSRKCLMQREKLIDVRRGRMEFMLACYKKHAYSWVAMKGVKTHG